MKNWGIGIEHEMRIRYSKKIPEFPNEYIFVSSFLLLYFFGIYEQTVMKKFNKYVITDEEKKYYDKIALKNIIKDMAIDKKPYPLDNKLFFDIESTLEKMSETKELLKYYISIYTLYHAPLLYFSYIFSNNIHISINNFIDLNSIHTIDLELKNLYNNNHEKELLKYLKSIFLGNNVNKLKFDYSIKNEINIYCTITDINNKNNKNNKNVNFTKFIDMVQKTITIIKKHINTDIDIIKVEEEKMYKNLFMLYNYNLPEIDFSSTTEALEFKTIEYKELNYESALNQLIDYEKTFFYVMNNSHIIKMNEEKYGYLTYHNIGSVNNTIEFTDIINFDYKYLGDDYTGSYHIWLTPPYTPSTTMKKFTNTLITLANKLQLLEPILAGHYSSPSYNALTNSTFSKSSLRQFISGFTNYGTTDITLMNGIKNHDIMYYYLSEEDIINGIGITTFINSTEMTTNGFKYYDKELYKAPVYNTKGELILNYNRLTSRSITNNIYKIFSKGEIESNNNISLNNYFSMLFEDTKIRPVNGYYKYLKYLELGADIRTRDLNEYYYPLDKDWTRHLVLKKNKLIEVYYNKKINKISYERVYDKKEYSNKLNNDRIGIEFRIFDHFPTQYLDQILSILPAIVVDSYKKPKSIKFKNTYVAKQFWHNEMFNVLKNGYKYKLQTPYIHALEKEFGIEIEKGMSYNTENIMQELYYKLSRKYARTRKNSLFNKMKFNKQILFENFNKKAWAEIIKYYFNKNPHLLEKLTYLNSTSTTNKSDTSKLDTSKLNKKAKQNIAEILGNKLNYDVNKIKNYINEIK